MKRNEEKIMKEINYYVSNRGSDANDGSFEKPFRSLERAQKAVREAPKTAPITVNIRGGEYKLRKPLKFGPEDSGTPECPVTYRGYKNERPFFNGGTKIPANRITKVTDPKILDRVVDKFAASKLMQMDLRGIVDRLTPLTTNNGWTEHPQEIYINGTNLTPARWPNDVEGEAYLLSTQTMNDRHNQDRMPFAFKYDDPTDHAAKYWSEKTLKDLNIYGFLCCDWSDGVYKVDNMDFSEKFVEANCGSGWRILGGHRFYFLNLLEEIDVPGESFIDRFNKIVYFYPPSDMRGAEVYISTYYDHVFELEGTSNLTFKNMKIAYTRMKPITAKDVENFVIDDVTICHISSQAVSIRGKNCAVRNCHMYDTDGGIISIYGGDRQTLTPANHVVENNRLHTLARHCKCYAEAIGCGGCGITIRNNKMYDSAHLVVGINRGNDIDLEYNEIYNAVKESSDMGAVYYGRDVASFGIRFIHNYFHHVGNNYGGAGQQSIFVDDGSADPYVYGNIFYRGALTEERGGKISDAFAVKANGGQYGIYKNNIFVDVPCALRFQTWKWMYSTDGAYFEWPGQKQGGWWQWVAGDGTWKEITQNLNLWHPAWIEKYGNSQWAPIFKMFSEELREEWKALKADPSKSKEYENFLEDHAPEASNLCEENVAIKTIAFTKGQPYTGNARGKKNYSAPSDILPSGNSMFVDYGKDFKLTEEGLKAVRKVAPNFENIPTEKIGLKPFIGEDGKPVFVGGIEPTTDKVHVKRNGNVYSANYKYISPLGVKEGNSRFLWYICDTKSGEYAPINNRRDREIPVDEAMKGKFLKVSVMVQDRETLYSEPIFSAPIEVL